MIFDLDRCIAVHGDVRFAARSLLKIFDARIGASVWLCAETMRTGLLGDLK
jgi:hypothetical protein